MLARIRKAQEEEGFTLIELLVVMIIIGILAAIAIPVFLNQRKSGYDAGAKSDVRNAATAQETFFTDASPQSYTDDTTVLPGWKQSQHTLAVVTATFSTSAGETVADAGAVAATDDSYVIEAASESGKTFCWDSSNSQKGVYAGSNTSFAPGDTLAPTTEC